MSVYPSFPQELIDKIIQTLDGPNAQSTLVACCTVSSSFCNTAQKLLYRSLSVLLGHPKDAARNEALESSLMSSNHLSTYVDSISVLIESLEPSSDISFAALDKLNRLRSLRIEGTPQWANWYDLPDIFRHNVSTVLGFPTLRNFRLSYMYNFPLSYLCAVPSLQKLDVEDTTLLDDIVFDTTDHPAPSIDTQRQGSLQTLLVREQLMHLLYPVFLSPLSPLHASGLRKLEVSLRKESDVIGLKALLGVANSSLEELDILANKCAFPVDSPQLRLELERLQNLRHVAFSMQHLADLRYVANLCESLRNGYHLDGATFFLAGELCGLADVRAIDKTKPEWRRIDEYLVGGHGTPPSCVIRVMKIGGYQSNRSIRAFFEENMQHIYSAGRLRVMRRIPGRTLVDIL
ncbi:hypothetical protein FPV67DRAFT_1675244 [Lyophyllum atratum]|nr:hypothetical protein FPV67DRAFT_1675244 [Lyophyllum atratum]